MSTSSFCPPAVPLITHTPYFSLWSFNNSLTDDWTKHWTGASQGTCGLIRIDGVVFRFMGGPVEGISALAQDSVNVSPLVTTYTFSGHGIKLTLRFLSPLLPEDLNVLARPVTYMDFIVESNDAKSHDVQLYVDVTGGFAVNTHSQDIGISRYAVGDRPTLAIRSCEQDVLKKAGDNLRIDWGTLILQSPPGESWIGSADQARQDFVNSGALAKSDELITRRRASDGNPGACTSVDLGQVGVSQPASGHFTFAYDEEFAIQYFHRNERPYWSSKGTTLAALLEQAESDHDSVVKRAEAFDSRLLAELERVGGPDYSTLGALAFRQTIAGHGLVSDPAAGLLMFEKENFSNGCLATVDVIFPAAPFFLYFSPELMEAQLRPVMEYSASPQWRFPFAPHDLGTYPIANGQVYGGGELTEEDQMPIEETGNMLILLNALGRVQGHYEFAQNYYPTIEKWAKYLEEFGFDPSNQLCTDDFAGHLAHNANLSLKAIIAMRAFGEIASRLGHDAESAKAIASAKEWATKWLEICRKGDHTLLAFDQPESWSLKYNLVWDLAFGYGLFPKELLASETAFYIEKLNEFGTPLDSRASYTKSDWILWAATFAPSEDQFRQLIAPIVKFANETPDRLPLTDWHDTVSGKCVGFRARTVVGGYFMKLLLDSGKLNSQSD